MVRDSASLDLHTEVILPKQNAAFVAHMEGILDLYQQPYNPERPTVNIDERPIQRVLSVCKHSCLQGCQHCSDVFRQIHATLPLKVRSVFVDVMKQSDDFRSLVSGNTQV